jgi:hypothetical protein
LYEIALNPCDIVDEIAVNPRMHQTTVRFGVDLWADLEQTAAGLGISVAQYIREATLARLAYNAGERGAPSLGAPLERLSRPDDGLGRVARDVVDDLGHETFDYAAESSAVWAQSQQARARSKQLRDAAQARRRTPLG